MAKVFIDAGHGGKDPGATGNGLREKDITLSIATKVAKILQRHKISVGQTRTKDTAISVSERAKKANSFNADIFVSIHANAFTSASAQGVEVFSFPSSSNGAKLSRALLSSVLSAKLYTKNRGTKTANFAVLRQTKMPAALIEMGFITNSQDAAMLKNRQEEFATAIAKGILNYLGIKYVEEKKPTQKPAPKPKAKNVWDYYISGNSVKQLQRELNKQFKKGLSVDGLFGNDTMGALIAVRKGAKGNITKIIQERLAAKGFSPGAIDGIFGPSTEKSVKQFQRYNKLAVDGIVGKNTWKALFRK